MYHFQKSSMGIIRNKFVNRKINNFVWEKLAQSANSSKL